jgi:hypothetical protein
LWFRREKAEADRELKEIRECRAARVALLEYPSGYTLDDLKKDRERLEQLRKARFAGKKLTPREDAEEAHLAVRVLHPKAEMPKIELPSFNKYKMEWPMTRMVELEERVLAGDTTAADEEELKDLRSHNPEIAADVDRLDHSIIIAFVRRQRKQRRPVRDL